MNPASILFLHEVNPLPSTSFPTNNYKQRNSLQGKSSGHMHFCSAVGEPLSAFLWFFIFFFSFSRKIQADLSVCEDSITYLEVPQNKASRLLCGVSGHTDPCTRSAGRRERGAAGALSTSFLQCPFSRSNKSRSCRPGFPGISR